MRTEKHKKPRNSGKIIPTNGGTDDDTDIEGTLKEPPPGEPGPEKPLQDGKALDGPDDYFRFLVRWNAPLAF
jgi:hypothetical protein